jgi:hypothetical protein
MHSLRSMRPCLAASAIAWILASGCSARSPESAPATAPAAVPAPLPVEAEPPESDSRNAPFDELRKALSESEEARLKLTKELELQSGARTALEEENASLELELAIALDELLRIQANLKNVKSRAFAVSRIAEVRVELESLRGGRDVALDDRLDRADRFLQRADKALDEDNVGGAAFLAERAGELVRQSRTIAEVRSRQSKELLPIVPPREIEVRAAANLRSAPRSDSERVGGVVAGTRLTAIARLGDWFQVRTDSGRDAWIHRGLVQ